MVPSEFEAAGLNYDTVAAGVDGIERIMNDFPALRGTVSSLEFDGEKPGAAVTNYNLATDKVRIILSSPFTLAPTEYNAVVNRGSLHRNGTAASSLAHELGHAMESAICAKKYSDNWDAFKARKNGTEAKRILEVARVIVNHNSGKSYSLEALSRGVSRYATKNPHEALAECIGDVYANGTKASAFSRTVYEVLRRELS